MAKGTIRINAGFYKDTNVAGMVFPLVKAFEMGARGQGFVAVRNTDQVPGGPSTMRITCSGPMDYEFVNASAVTAEVTAKPAKPAETDEQIMARIRERFEILDEITQAAVNGDIRAAIVSGPPGVGKSFGVERVVEKNTLMDVVASRRLKCEVVKGSATPIGLYQTLYKFSDANCMVVFDDCDSILLDDVSLNLLKGALDSGKKRKISWLSESSVLRREGIPDSFEFKGSVIFITNLKFDQMKSQKLRDHLDALQSRCHYLDLTLDTMRDKVLRIKQIADDGELFADYEFEKCVEDEIIDFLNENKDSLREMSLRMAIKIADLRKSFPVKWKAMAQITCMRQA
jgi:hypothetical protein